MGSDHGGMSRLEYHVLLSLADGPLYGYAVAEAIEAESDGALAPKAGSLYRVIARLMSAGWVEGVEPEGDPEPHPGRARKYYGLTGEGRRVLAEEAERLRQAAALAERRLGVRP